MGAAAVMIVALVAAAYILLQMGDTVNTTATPQVEKLAIGIATAEGFYTKGSRPQRNNNPGDMTQDLIHRAIGMDGPFPRYATAEDGWANLYAQINLWLSGGSQHADSTSTITDLSGFYTADNQSSWAINVANAIGVSVDTSIGDIPA